MGLSDVIGEGQIGQSIPDGSRFGDWEFVFNGFGDSIVERSDSGLRLHLCPQTSVGEQGDNNTHACLMLGPLSEGDFSFSCQITVNAQLRQEADPAMWEVAWIFWNAESGDIANYFMLKPNGCELGRRDPSGRGGQIFLATPGEPTLQVGVPYNLQINQSGRSLQIQIDGELAIDGEFDLCQSGRIGFYCEDADVYFDQIQLG